MSLSANHKDNYNALIYGTRYAEGMFRCIKVWYESSNMKSLADKHGDSYLHDGRDVCVIVLFGIQVLPTSIVTKTYFRDMEEYKEFLDSIYKRSILNKKFNYKADETRICTLVTCTNVPTNPDERYVLHGILTRGVPYS
jgi:hypothetical protein